MSFGRIVVSQPRWWPLRLREALPVALAGERAALAVAVALALGFWALASYLVIAEYDTFHRHNFRDFATYANVLWNTGQGRPYQTTLLYRNTSHLAEHVAPVLLPLALLFRLVPDPRLLVALQQGALALAGFGLYLLARARLGTPWGALVVPAGFYLAPNLSDAILFFGFYPVALTTVPLVFGAYFILTGRPWRGALVAASTLLIEETSALALFGLGLLLLLHRRPRSGLLLAGLATAWLGFAALVFMPAHHLARTLPEAGNRTLDKFSDVMADPRVALERVIERGPGLARWFLLPTAGLPLLAPQALVAALPTSGVLLLQHYEQDIISQRITPAIPLVWVAAVEGLAALGSGRRRAIGLGLMGALTLATYLASSQLPGGGLYDPRHITWDEASGPLARAVAAIPPEAAVAATRNVAVHLADREKVWIFPFKYVRILKPRPGEVDWWVLDTTEEGVAAELPREQLSPLRLAPTYGLWLIEDSVLVATKSLPRPTQSAAADFGGVLRLGGYEIHPTQSGITLRLWWRVAGPPGHDYLRLVSLVGADGRRLAEQKGPATRSYYGTAQWKEGQEVLEELSLPLAPADRGALARVQLRWREADTGKPLTLPNGSAVYELPVQTP